MYPDMEKQKPWQLWLILAVVVLTIINILPTIFYYSKPLHEPIGEKQAETVALNIIDRVNDLENDSKGWLESFCKLLGIKPESIAINKDDPGMFSIQFKTPHDAKLFRSFLPKAGALIPFVPAQLALSQSQMDGETTVMVQRQIDVHLDPKEVSSYFHFVPKKENGAISQGYKNLVYNRAEQILLNLAGSTQSATMVAAIADSAQDIDTKSLLLSLASDINEMEGTLGQSSPILKRYFASFTQINDRNPKELIQKFTTQMEGLKKELEQQKEPSSLVQGQIKTLEKALAVLKKNGAEFEKGQKPYTEKQIQDLFTEAAKKTGPKAGVQMVSLQERNPYIQSVGIDWENDKILLKFYPDVQAIRQKEAATEVQTRQKDRVNQGVFNEIARLSQATQENVKPDGEEFAIALSSLQDVQSFLAFDLGFLAEKQLGSIKDDLLSSWQPTSLDLVRKNYPVLDWKTFSSQKGEDQKLGLVLVAPANLEKGAPQGFRNGSLYVIARGLEPILAKAKQAQGTKEAQQIQADASKLNEILRSLGFISYPGSSWGMDKSFSQDRIFELNDYYSNLLSATREEFKVLGSQKQAVLDFTDLEQRLLTQNRIDDRIQEDLVKWKEEYGAAQADLNITRHTEVPAPDKNVYWENFKLGLTKYFRGDDRKVLKWGLDLSGGKTVRIGLKDHNGRPVTNPDDLKQAVNELYNRVNKMGVAERTIRIENENIILDFPGSQAFSAQELVKASAMYFHIVNEKFSRNPELHTPIQKFLQEVWNEAVVTNRKDAASINEIAWKNLGGDQTDLFPRSEAAKTLYDNGLRLANPKIAEAFSSFDDSLSTIAVMQGEEPSSWAGQTHPLMIVFHNFALEGSSLTNVQAGYDPTQGNVLNFQVKASYDGTRQGSPRDDFFAWTSQFSQEKVVGTPLESYSEGQGWRMAVILNEQVITAPTLSASLKDGGTIHGRFTPREINKLAADLKAGSLSFTPRILSEQNVSPELGKEERFKGISSALIGLASVAFAMIGYYRFAGLVATCAVLFNLLIMWGVLQNIGAAITLPGIAGIVLTIGMAVDANVLVFERFREEFKLSGRLASAMQAGYKKAFSAIVDSNITTILAALILIQFDSGPIKGFAVTLIIGIVSSMFTALFMTRFFFAGWVQNPKNKHLTFSEWVKNTNFDFLGQAKKAIIISLMVMIAGGFLFFQERHSIFGMDFTGGYSLNVEVQESKEIDSYRLAAIDGLEKNGANPTNIEVRELSRPNQLRIQLGMGMEQPGQPFYQMPEKQEVAKAPFEYLNDPRIVWTVNALESAGLKIQPSELSTLHLNFSMMSGQFSDAMRSNALWALGFALLSVLVYITIRFEFKFAISAGIALAHDIAITLGFLAFFRWIGLAVQIDLQVIGAIMTIIGYSLNDTIIVFDRIREDLHVLRKLSYAQVINHAINVTLSRTLMTSGSTLLVLMCLVLFGGPSIFDFSLVMTVGVLIGTFSSLFIAGPCLLYFHNREEKQAGVRALS
jgi:SecD/SecF fusion protein